MSRGYSDGECDDHRLYAMHEGALRRAIYGKRGQALLRELLETLDAMPDKRLAYEWGEAGGCSCALGEVARRRGMDIDRLASSYEHDIGPAFGVSETLGRQIMYTNDTTVGDPGRTFEPVFYFDAEGRRFSSYMIETFGERHLIEHAIGPLRRVGRGWHDPAPEEIEASQRQRWAKVRMWVAEHIIKQEEA